MVNEYIIYNYISKNNYSVIAKQLKQYAIREVKGSALERFFEILSDNYLQYILDMLNKGKDIYMELAQISINGENVVLSSSFLLTSGQYEREDFKLQLPLCSLINIIKIWLLLKELSTEQFILSRTDNVISIRGGNLTASTTFERYVYPWEEEEEGCESITYQPDSQGNYSSVAIDLDECNYLADQSPLAYLSVILTSGGTFINNLCADLDIVSFKDILLNFLVIQSDEHKVNMFNSVSLKFNGDVKASSFYKYSLKNFLHMWLSMTSQNVKSITLSRKDSLIRLGSKGITCTQTLKVYHYWIEA